MKITLLAIGKARGPEAEWSREYLKRLGTSVTLHEFTVSKTLSPAETQKAEAALLLKAVTPKSYIVVLDERGRDLTSRELSAKLRAWHEQAGEVTFIIGGADGLTDEIRRQANFVLCLGRLTWPHRLVRVMVLEQLYRAQQIIAGHPYHRE